MWEDGIFTAITCPEVPQNNSHYFHQTRVKHNPQCPSTTTQPGPLDQVSVCTYMYIDKRSKRRKQNKNCCMQVPSNRPLRFLHLKFHATLHNYEYGLHMNICRQQSYLKESIFKIPYHQYYCIKKSSSRHQIHFPPAATTEVLCSWIQLIELLDFLRFLPTFYRVQFDQYLPIRQFSWALLSLSLLAR